MNVDTFSLSNINQPEFNGYVQNQMILVGQTSGAQARISNVRLISDISSWLQGSFFIPDNNRNPSAPRFETGNKLFRLTSDIDNTMKSSTRAEEEYRAEGFHDVVQETIISTRNASVEMTDVSQTENISRITNRGNISSDTGWQTIRQRFLGDPLAQTFNVEDETGVFFTRAEGYFRSKDDMEVPVNFSIRTVTNGIPNKTIVPISEMRDRLKAAIDSKLDDSFFIMARTDAIASEGIDGAIKRCKEYLDEGVDGIFLEAATSIEEYRTFKNNFSAPVLANITEFGKTPLFTQDELKEVGVDMVLYPLTAFRAMSLSAEKIYNSIIKDGTQESHLDIMQTREELYEVLDYYNYEKQLDEKISDK